MGVGSISGLGRRAGSSKLVERLGRTGLVAKGVLYGVVAILALQVALGARGEDPDKDGALRAIAQQPFEKVLLAVLALGLAGYAVWRLAQGFLDRDDEGEGAKGLAKRAGAIGRAVWYGALCALVVSKLVGAGSGSSSGSEDRGATGTSERPA